MAGLKLQLERWLRNVGRLVVLGVGNRMQGDDGAGVLVARRLSKLRLPEGVMVVEAGVSPENFTEKIVKFRPTHLLIVDAALFKAKPGSIRLFTIDRLGGVIFSTHRLPLTLLVDYLKHFIPNVEVRLLAIKPERVEWGEKPSAATLHAIDEAAKILAEILAEKFNF
ncbi:MAG: hydrogenase maturation peptidase HycI [Candidatus Hecatellales archaeon]|nr:MAG: hydrogenase maturation peptidase HycI [Candidatus Hecatellales archaeon]